MRLLDFQIDGNFKGVLGPLNDSAPARVCVSCVKCKQTGQLGLFSTNTAENKEPWDQHGGGRASASTVLADDLGLSRRDGAH